MTSELFEEEDEVVPAVVSVAVDLVSSSAFLLVSFENASDDDALEPAEPEASPPTFFSASALLTASCTSLLRAAFSAGLVLAVAPALHAMSVKSAEDDNEIAISARSSDMCGVKRRIDIAVRMNGEDSDWASV